MKNVWLAQPNYRFGDNAFFPYSVGRLWAYASSIPEIKAQYRLAEMVWDREPIADVLLRVYHDIPAVFGFSTYIWNEAYNLSLAKAVRQKFPNCLIVFGGPQVPHKGVEEYLHEHSFIDAVVHGEGELAFAAILQHPREEWPACITYRQGDHIRVAPESGRVAELADLPSPYLSGVFDRLRSLVTDVQWQALHETDRGCPYACTFCVWGSASLNKVRAFPMEQLKAEIGWFSDSRIEILYNCDANFAMLPHHEVFADELIRVRRETGYPQKFRAAYAKKITERVFRGAKKLSDAGMSKGATISFQSMNEQVLDNVKRLNPVQTSLSDTLNRYNAAGISTYSEMILGLPGETYESFLAGIDQLLEAGQHTGLAVYPCMMLRNSELGDPEYVKKHGLVTMRVKQLLLHGTRNAWDVDEEYDLVVQTNTLSNDAWLKAWLLAIVIQALHVGGLTTRTAIFLHQKTGMKYTEFYRGLVDRALVGNGATVLGSAIEYIRHVIESAVYRGSGWGTTFPQWGGVEWPLEEALLLLILERREQFYNELLRWLPADQNNIVLINDAAAAPDPRAWDDKVAFAREVIWYGRKGKKPIKQEVTWNES